MKLKIAIIIVLSLLITLPSVAFAEKVEKTGYVKPVDVYAEQVNKGAQHNLRGPLYEDFEDLDITGWTIYNGSNPSNNVAFYYGSHDPAGLYCLGFSSMYSASSYVEWAITPKLTVATGDSIAFWYKDWYGYGEDFSVWVSTNTNAVEDFITQVGSSITTSDNAWHQFNENLDTFAGQDVYIGIKYSSDYMYYLMIDEVAGPEIWVNPDPVISLNTNAYDFDMIEAGTTDTFEVVITNLGTADLVISDVAINPSTEPFSCTYSGTIPYAERDTTEVIFAPTSAGVYGATVTFNNNAVAGDDTVAVTGSAFPPGHVFQGFEGTEFPPDMWAMTSGWSRYTYASHVYDGEASAKVSGDNTSWLFTPKLTVNTGDQISFYYQAESESYPSGLKVRLAPGTTTQTNTTAYTATLLDFDITSTEWNLATYTFDATYDGQEVFLAFQRSWQTATYYYAFIDNVIHPSLAPYSFMELSETSHDFGVLLTGTDVSWDLEITNSGTGDLTITGITGLEPPFSCDYSGVIVPGETVPISVLLDGTTQGIYEDTLIVESDADYGEGTVELSAAIQDPFTVLAEGFEGDFPPLYWTNDGWTQSTYGSPHSGDEFAYSMGSGDTLITPYFTVPTDPYNFSFWYRAESSSYPQTLLLNLYINTGRGWSRVDSLGFSSTEYQKGLVSLVPYAGQTVQLMFDHSYSGNDYWGMCLDDVALETMEPNIVLSDTTYNFGLVEQGTEATFDVNIYNDGGMPLIVYGTTADLPFSCDYADTIPFGGSDVATITFDTSNKGIFSGLLTFHTNATQTDSVIALSGAVFGSDYVLEGFEDVEFPPFGWSNPDGYWKRFTNDAYEGDGYARVSWYHEDDAILYSPHLIIESGDIISFYWINANLYDGKDGKVNDADITYFEISNDGTNWQVLATLNPEEEMTEYEFVCVAVPDDYIGINAEVRWRHVTENIGESRGVGLDNVMLPQPYLPINFYLDPYTQSDYNSIGSTVAYDVDIYNTGIQEDRYYISLADSKTRGKDVEDFESDDGGYVGTGLWQWGSPTSGPGNAHSGVNVWATNISGDYGTYANYTLDSPAIAIGSDEPTMTFWHWYDTENSYDGGNVKISTDGGGAWTVIEPVGGYPGTSNSYNPLYPEPIFCGHDQGFWEQVTFDLSTYAGQTASFRWHFGSDSSVQYPGWYIDDVDITSGGGPPPPPTGWPVTFSDDYLDIEPGEMVTFTASVTIPDDGSVIEDDVNTSTIYVESREDPLVNHEADVVTTAHPKDPYEPNNVIVDATPWAYGEITEEAQIYYNPDYADKDIDIYEFSGLAGDIILCDFILPPDELLFDGAIKLVDVDSTEIAYADSWAGGGSEQLKYRLLVDGTYYLVLGKWDNILDGPYKKDPGRGVNTCYYAMSLALIPSPDIAVSPDSLQLGIIYNVKTASVDMFIENTGVTGCDDLTFNIEVVIPGVEVLLHETFDDPIDWTTEGGTNWGIATSSYAGGVPPEAKFSWTPSTTGVQRLISPVLNTTGYTSLPLSFKHYVNDYNGDYTIGIATTSDGGVTWNDVWSTSPSGNIGPETFALTLDNADVGSANFQVCWYFDGNSFNINYWYIDDVDISTGTPWCSVEPLAGSIGQGAIQTCVVTCDETGLTEPGIYTADIIVHNNALLDGASDVTIPLTFFYQVAALGLQGTVTSALTGEPIDSVKVSAGNYVTYTNSDGFYQFTDIATGTYDVVFEKPGFATLTRPGIYVSPNWVTLLDVEMLFDGPVPENLSATGIQEAIELDWDKPDTGGGGTEYEIVYDDGVAENATAWYDAGNMNAVRFTPDGYPCTIISADMNVYDGSWPVGSLLQPFEVAVFDDDGTGGLPGTELGRLTVTPTHYDFIDVDLSSLGISIDAGDFYIAHIQGGAYPNCLPTAIDETVPTVNRSYSRYVTGGEDWALSSYQDFMIRATVNGPRGTNELKEQIVTFPSNGMTKEMFVNGSSPITLEHYVDPKTGNELVGNGITRDIILQGYNVYEVTKGFVAYVEGENNTEYLDDIVAVGTEYTYWATAVYDAGESGPSNTDSAVPLPAPPGYHEPFDLDWSTTGWTTAGSPNNWGWSAGYAVLKWSPSVPNYDMSLISPNIVLPTDPLDVYDLTVSMYLSNYSSSDGEVWEVWLIHDGGEDLLWSYNDPTEDWGVSGGTDWVYTDTAQYAGQTVQIKFRSHGGTTFNFNYWYIYDVLFDMAPVPPEYGALEGVVTDGDLVPLDSVAVDADFLDYNTVYTDADGFYSIDPMRVGLYDVTFSKVGYCTITVEDVEIVVGDTTLLDVILGMPTMDIEPTSIPDATVPVGGTSTRTITVTNNGDAPLSWTASIVDPTKQRVSIPPAPTDFPRSEDKLSSSLAPQNEEPTNSSTTPMINPLRGTTAYAFNVYPGSDFVTFDTDAPETWLTTIPMTYTPFAADFDIDDNFYAVDYDTNNLYAVDIETGVFTLIGPTQASTDLACDKTDGTMYAASYYGLNSYLYTIDLTTGSATLIGLINTDGLIISMACDSEGNLWGFDIVDDALYAIDKDDGHGTYVGSVGFDGNYAQSMAWDPESEIVYMAAYNNTVGAGQLRIVDTSNGATALVGTFSGGAEVAGLGFPGGGARWIWLSEYSGSVPPGCDSLVTVYFDACEDPAGTTHTCDIIFESDPDVGTVTVPVTLLVGELEYGDLNGYVTAATGGAPIEGAEITASNDADYTYVTYSDEYGFYEILDMMVGYYDVECTAVGYNDQVVYDVEIVIDQTTPLNFEMTAPVMVVDPLIIDETVHPDTPVQIDITIQNEGDGPMDFNVNLYLDSKTQTDYSRFVVDDDLVALRNTIVTGSSQFTATQNRDDVIIEYQNGYGDNGIGTGGVFSAIAAARFTSDELSPYYDTYSLTKVNIHIRSADFTLVELKVFEGGSFGNAGTEIYSEDITGDVLIEQWTEHTLTAPIPIVSGNEYWIGYAIDAIYDHPMSVDSGPMEPNKGAWMYFSGSWSLLTDLNPALDYNWCIQGVLSPGLTPWITVDPLFGTIPAGGDSTLSVFLNTVDYPLGTILNAFIEIVSDPDVGVVTVPVTVLVSEVATGGDTPVTETKLYANFPNPMLNTTTFNFSLKERSHVKLTIYNVKGQLVGILLDEDRDPNAKHAVVWDGTANGKKLANGIYFYKLETNSKTFLKKMILMK